MYDDDMSGVINQQASVSTLLGMSPGGARLSGYEGGALPATTFGAQDNGAVPWSPDSPVFWLAVLGLGTLFGFIGASADFRVGRARIGAEVNA